MHAPAVLRGVLSALSAGIIAVAIGSGRPVEALPVIAIYGLIFAVPFAIVAFAVAWIAASARLTVRWWHAPAIAGGLAGLFVLVSSGSPGGAVMLAGMLGMAGGIFWLGAFGTARSIPFALGGR